MVKNIRNLIKINFCGKKNKPSIIIFKIYFNSIGGAIELLEWDPTGQRLAVSFKSIIYIKYN